MNKLRTVFCIFMFFNYIHGMDQKICIWDAQDYKKNSFPQYFVANSVLSSLALHKEDTVLDCGCGDGKITRTIAEMVSQGSVLGIDFSENMIMQATIDHEKQKNLRFEHADITFFKSNKEFTKAVAFCSLSWVKDQQRAYTNIANALRPGGKFVALVSNAESAIMRAYRKPVTYPRWSVYFEDYTPCYYPSKKDDVIAYMKDAGFDSIKVESFATPSLSMNRDALLKTMAATPGVKDVVPEEYYMDYLNNVVDEYLKEIPQDEEGNIQLDLGLFIVEGERVR